MVLETLGAKCVLPPVASGGGEDELGGQRASSPLGTSCTALHEGEHGQQSGFTPATTRSGDELVKQLVVIDGETGASDCSELHSASHESEARGSHLVHSLESFRQKRRASINAGTGIGKFVVDPRFDGFILIVVLINAGIVGLQINEQAIGGRETEAFEIAEYICSLIFVLELVIRMGVLKSALLWKENLGWTALDFTLVVLSVFEFILATAFDNEDSAASKGSYIAKIMKAARVVRVLRILRTVRFLAKLRSMVSMIASSLVSLWWLFILLTGVVYAFSIVLTQGATDWRIPPSPAHPPVHDPRYEEVGERFGSVLLTMYTLYCCTIGGISWGIPADLTRLFGLFYFAVICFFMFFIYFSVLNIVTGVFVDCAIQHANTDRALRLMREDANQRMYQDDLLELLLRLDLDKNGNVSINEWKRALDSGNMKNLLSALDVRATDAMKLFRMLDKDRDNELSVAEFVDGMEKLKGDAQSLDVHDVLRKLDTLTSVCSRVAASSGIAKA